MKCAAKMAEAVTAGYQLNHDYLVIFTEWVDCTVANMLFENYHFPFAAVQAYFDRQAKYVNDEINLFMADHGEKYDQYTKRKMAMDQYDLELEAREYAEQKLVGLMQEIEIEDDDLSRIDAKPCEIPTEFRRKLNANANGYRVDWWREHGRRITKTYVAAALLNLREHSGENDSLPIGRKRLNRIYDEIVTEMHSLYPLFFAADEKAEKKMRSLLSAKQHRLTRYGVKLIDDTDSLEYKIRHRGEGKPQGELPEAYKRILDEVKAGKAGYGR